MTNQKGFSHVLLLIFVALVIGAISFTGWQVSIRQHKHNPGSSNYVNNQSGYSGPSGNSSPANFLPACTGKTLLNHLPTDTSALTGIEALGHMNGQHVLPSQGDHVSMIMVPASTTTSQVTNVYSPGNVTIVQVTAMTQTANSTVTGQSDAGHTDYLLDFASCRDVVFALGHIETLTNQLLSNLSQTQPQCSDGTIVNNCVYNNLKIVLSGGELIGTAGGPSFPGNAFDFGAVDDRTATLPFIDTSSRAASTGFINLGNANSYSHAVCPLDYFTPNLKQLLYSRLTMENQGVNGIPACGTTMQDKKGTIQGDWYDQNTNNLSQGLDTAGVLAFAHSNLDASKAEVSVGTDLVQSQYGGTQLIFTPASSGYINRDPGQITADGRIYCFDGLEGAILGAQGNEIHFDTKLINTSTLKIDYGMGSCAPNPTLSPDAITYNR